MPIVGVPLSVLKDEGIYEGERLLVWLRELLAQRGVSTFRDLVHPDSAAEPRYRYRLQVIASDITARRILVLPAMPPGSGSIRMTWGSPKRCG